MRCSRIIVLLVLVGTMLSLVNCSRIVTFAANIPGYFGPFERHADIAYGSNARARLDVYSPNEGHRRPVVVFWHGGLWIEGSRTQYRFVGAALVRAGYVAVLPDYRLYPEVRFPGFVQDGASAVRWVHEHIAEYGGDPDAIFLMGHSAGAHIAALIALEGRYLQAEGGSTSWVRGLIGLSGPYAIETEAGPTSLGICAANVRCARLLPSIFSAPYSRRDWQPVSAAAPDSPPTLLLHGANDSLVAVRHAEILRDRLVARHAIVELRVYPDCNHGATIGAFSLPSFASVPALDDVRRFIGIHVHRERAARTALEPNRSVQ